MKKTIIAAVLVAPGLIVAEAQAQQRAAASLTCTPTGKTLTYDCDALITDQASKAPIEGLNVEVKADMPSMPMAHNIPPEVASPGDAPGHYRFAITLDMPGSWAFSMRLSGPREDLVVEVLDFADESNDAQGHGHGSDHGAHGGHGSSHGSQQQ